MSIGQRLKRLGIDTYLALLLGTILLATVLPVSGAAADVVRVVSLAGVALLFFLYGAKLDTSTVIAGIANWRVQLLVLVITFIAFPLLALAMTTGLAPWLDPNIVIGLLFVGALPSTVQSSVAFTALARGNVAAAVCAASISNLLGVVLTPLLCAVLLHSSGTINPAAVGAVALQILLPFVLGQIARRWIGGWVSRNRMLTLTVDRGSILLIVYSAFSAGMVSGVWAQVAGTTLALTPGCVAVLFVVIAVGAVWIGRLVGLPPADRMTLLFCGSTKSLASGVPMASILFAGQPISLIILPLMLFHQLQLIVCAIIAQRRAALSDDGDGGTAPAPVAA